MIIRPAVPSDASQLAVLINMAMLDITYQFIGQQNVNEANSFIECLVKEQNNQYSYQNIFVLQELDTIIGHICIYDGSKFEELRKPVFELIQKQYGHAYSSEAETSKGEMYIDTFAISPQARGKGYAKELLNFAIDYYVNKQKKVLGLLVDLENPKAKHLYEKIGFKVIEERNIFGKKMEHMQYT